MFTGIIESVQAINGVKQRDHSVEIRISKPESFTDLKTGDSIAVNGVCLTLEEFDSDLVFTLGFETLKVMSWVPSEMLHSNVNLERSLRLGDRIHGHLVSGHADGRTQLLRRYDVGDCLIMDYQIPSGFEKYFWQKGSVTLNGVSLTVNEVLQNSFSVCLIPETLRKTNLNQIKVGQSVSFECDYLMKGFLNARKYHEADNGR